MKQAQIQSAYILSTRPFRDTSLLVKAFSRDYGLVSLIARGAKGALLKSVSQKKRHPRFQGLIQPFVPLLLSWKGSTDLLNLVACEPNGYLPFLEGKSLFYGWYLNELLSRFLVHYDPHPELFEAYQQALRELTVNSHLSLRRFEKKLLNTLGIIPQLDCETKTGDCVQPNQWYYLHPEQGILNSNNTDFKKESHIFQGVMLLMVQSEAWQQAIPYLPQIKKLFRILLDHALGGIKIRSRELVRFNYFYQR